MIYLAKIALRRKILGLDIDNTVTQEEDGETIGDGDQGFTTSQDVIAVPDFRENTLRPSMIEGVKVDAEATKDPMTTPALNGAIPLAIFDAARKQPFFCAAAAGDFFDMFATFTQVRCLPRILQHVLDVMVEAYPTDSCTCDYYIRQPIMGMQPYSAELAAGLGITLERLKESMAKTKDKTGLSKRTRSWILRLLSFSDLDPGISTVLKHTLRRLE